MSEVIRKKIRDEIKKSNSYSFSIHLQHLRIVEFPIEIILLGEVTHIRRLDLSYNHISTIPPQISLLCELREFWIQQNPLITVPKEIELCSKLEILDLKLTKIDNLPPELCNMKYLHTLDFSLTPFANKVRTNYQISETNLTGLVNVLDNIYQRNKLKSEIVERLLGNLYLKESDNPQSQFILNNLVDNIDKEFPNLDEFKLFARRCDKLLPENLSLVDDFVSRILYLTDIKTVIKTKEKFTTMHNDTKKDRMAAEVEIKIRQIYFDRIERKSVENIIDSIYSQIHSLEDMQFLVRYATQLFPQNPADASGVLIWNNIVKLQADLHQKREVEAIKILMNSMLQIYPEQRPSEVESRSRLLAAQFQKERFISKRELNSLSRLAAEASTLLPPDFGSVDPAKLGKQIKILFSQT